MLVWEEMNANEQALLAVIDHRISAGRAAISQKDLAVMTGLDAESVKTALASLKGYGLIYQTKGKPKMPWPYGVTAQCPTVPEWARYKPEAPKESESEDDYWQERIRATREAMGCDPMTGRPAERRMEGHQEASWLRKEVGDRVLMGFSVDDIIASVVCPWDGGDISPVVVYRAAYHNPRGEVVEMARRQWGARQIRDGEQAYGGRVSRGF